MKIRIISKRYLDNEITTDQFINELSTMFKINIRTNEVRVKKYKRYQNKNGLISGKYKSFECFMLNSIEMYNQKVYFNMYDKWTIKHFLTELKPQIEFVKLNIKYSSNTPAFLYEDNNISVPLFVGTDKWDDFINKYYNPKNIYIFYGVGIIRFLKDSFKLDTPSYKLIDVLTIDKSHWHYTNLIRYSELQLQDNKD